MLLTIRGMLKLVGVIAELTNSLTGYNAKTRGKQLHFASDVATASRNYRECSEKHG